jgi:hypothetical protein
LFQAVKRERCVRRDDRIPTLGYLGKIESVRRYE